MDIALDQLNKKKKREDFNKIRNEKGNVRVEITDIQ